MAELLTWEVVCQVMAVPQKREEETLRMVDRRHSEMYSWEQDMLGDNWKGRMQEDHSPKAPGSEHLRACLKGVEDVDSAFPLAEGEELEARNNRE